MVDHAHIFGQIVCIKAHLLRLRQPRKNGQRGISYQHAEELEVQLQICCEIAKPSLVRGGMSTADPVFLVAGGRCRYAANAASRACQNSGQDVFKKIEHYAIVSVDCPWSKCGVCAGPEVPAKVDITGSDCFSSASRVAPRQIFHPIFTHCISLHTFISCFPLPSSMGLRVISFLFLISFISF